MSINVKLPRKTKGSELVRIIKDSLDSLDYRTSTELLDGCYESGSVELKETKTHVSGSKDSKASKGQVDMSFDSAIAYAVPIIGWIIYFSERKLSKLRCLNIDATLIPDEEYETVEFKVEETDRSSLNPTKYFDIRNLPNHPRIKEEFEKLVANIYSRLSDQPLPAANS